MNDVLSREFLLEQKNCCNNNCVNCPYLLSPTNIVLEGWDRIIFSNDYNIYKKNIVDSNDWWELGVSSDSTNNIHLLFAKEHFKGGTIRDVKFNGKCSTMKDFLYICKLLNIK